MSSTPMLSFPAGALGGDPVRLDLLAQTSDLLAVGKPAGVRVAPDELAPDAPELLAAMQAAIAAGRPQWRRLGRERIHAVHLLDAEATGVALFALSREAASGWRNAIGSREVEFRYDLVTVGDAGAGTNEHECALPLAPDPRARRMRVSHRQGRKCATHFTLRRGAGAVALWEAATRENRPHQVRVHAAECGLRISGEGVYGDVPLLRLSQFKTGFRPGRGGERPLHAPLCLHLRAIVRVAADGSREEFHCPRPSSLAALLRRLQLEPSEDRPTAD